MHPSLLALALSTLISEDAACIGAGLLVATGELTFLEASLSCGLGIFFGDLLLYAAGRFSHGLVRRWLGEERLARASTWLEAKGVSAIVTSRFTPGLRLPLYVAAGIVRTSLPLFVGGLLFAGAIWTPALIGAAALLGGRMLPLPLPVLLLLGYFGFKMLTKLVRIVPDLLDPWRRRRLYGRLLRLVRWEFWPTWAMYAPVFVYALWLSAKFRSWTLFTLSNPGIPSGGLVGESKSAILAELARDGSSALRFELLNSSLSVEDRIERARRWPLPLVLKPDTGERGAGVMVIRNEAQLRQYLQAHHEPLILQDYVAGVEFGILYCRLPDGPARIESLTAKTFPSLAGDGVHTRAQLILLDDRAVCLTDHYISVQAELADQIPKLHEPFRLVELGSHSRGSIFLDAHHLITPELTAAVDRVAQQHPGFHLGRFDVRAASLEGLRRGQFKVLELNGVGGEPTHIYDPAVDLWSAYRALFRHWRSAYQIGAWYRAQGHRPMPLRMLIQRIRGTEPTVPASPVAEEPTVTTAPRG